MSWAGVNTTWPLVGRDDVLQRIDVFVGEQAEQGLLLAGEAGVGKTRLRQELVQRARAAGHHVVEVAATGASADVPLGVFAPHLRLPEGRSPSRTELLRAAHRSLALAAGSRRLVLSVDDAHLLDSLSAQLVHQAGITEPQSLVLTLRTGRPAPDPIVALWRGGLCERVETPALDDASMEALVEHALSGADAALAGRLTGLARGNPLYLRELVLGAVETRAITKHLDSWVLAGELTASSRLRDLISARLGTLHGDQLAAIELLAVGEPLGLADLARTAGAGAVEDLVRRGIVEVGADQDRQPARLSHPLVAETVRSRMGSPARRRRARQLSDALIAHGLRRHQDTLTAASLQLDGDGPPDADLLTRAAGEAATFLAGGLTERLATEARAAGAGMEAELLRCRALEIRGRVAEAAWALERIHAEARSPEDILRSGVALAMLRTFRRDRFEAAREVHANLRAQLPAHLAPLVDAHESEALLWSGAVAQAERLARRALGARLDDAESEAAAAAVAAIASAHSCDPAFALDNSERYSRRAAGAGLPGRAAQILNGLIFALPAVARVAEGDALGGYVGDRIPAGVRGTMVEGLWAYTCGWSRNIAGHTDDASRLLDRGRELIATGGDYFGVMRAIIALRGQVAALGGAPGDDDALVEGFQATPGPDVTFDGELLRARALTAFARDDIDRGIAHARNAAEVGERTGLRLVQALALHDVVRNGAPEVVRDDLARLARDAHPDWLGRHFLEQADALCDGDAQRLWRLAHRLAEFDYPLYAADAAAQAARLLTGEDPLGAFLLTRLSERLAERSGTPTTRALRGRPRILTHRETEICELAALGRTARQIAGHLVLSVRTVENHLYRARNKLGVAAKAELASALAPLGG